MGAAALGLLGGPATAAFTVLHGAGNGPLTVAKGALPLALFGPTGYGLRAGLLSVPARVAQAGAPLAFGPLLDRAGLGTPVLPSGLGLASAAALMAVRPSRAVEGVPVPPVSAEGGSRPGRRGPGARRGPAD